MSRVLGVIDCGTSSVRGSIAEATASGELIVLEELQRDVDLRHVFHEGRLRRSAMDAIVEVLGDIRAAFGAYQPEQLRAVATSALRTATNTDVLLERIENAIALPIEVIDAEEEARLYYGGLQRCLADAELSLQGDIVLADLGSGATIVSHIRGRKLAHCVEEHFGTLRLLNDFRPLQDSIDFISALDRFAHGAAAMMVRRLHRLRRTNLAITGDEVRCLAASLGVVPQGRLSWLEADQVEAWIDEARPLTRLGLAERLDLDPDEAVARVLAAALIVHLSRETGQPRVLVPGVHLRDGLLADAMPGPGTLGPHHLSRTHLLAAARQLATRYGSNRDYVRNTASLACQLFDQTQSLHHLGQRERTLLEFAAWVHDLGSYVNARSRHKHTYYLIQASDIAGLSDLEKGIVANVARYHRQSTPKPTHEDFWSLPRQARVVVAYLSALLRLAYALDVERTQRIRKVRCRLEGDRLLVQVDRRQVTLERWSLLRRADMFVEVFGLDVDLLPLEE